MSNDKDGVFGRLFKLFAMIGKMVMDGKRDPKKVADYLQIIVDDSGMFLPEEPEKFALLVDLGTITVPDDYDHATALKSFGEKNRKKFYTYNNLITDQNFPNPSRVLKPGDRLRVRAFQQVAGGTTTSEERMDFLRNQKAVFTGAQGASLVFNQKRDQLPKGKWYVSFDEPDHLWIDAVGRHRVPSVDAFSGGGFDFYLGSFENVWNGGRAFLCFCEIEN